MKNYVCGLCSWTYNEAEGYPEGGIAPGTKWDDLPDDFVCPICGAGKDEFAPGPDQTASDGQEPSGAPGQTASGAPGQTASAEAGQAASGGSEQAASAETPVQSDAPAAFDKKVTRNFSYGLFVLTAKDGEKDNGCIINTAIQAASEPLRVSIAVNKANYTHDMILKTGMFNLSILSENSKFATYQNFGFQSGRDTDKLNSVPFRRSANGIAYLTQECNAYISGKVVQSIDLGSHTMFIADVTGGEVLSKDPSVTYAYYFKNIKPKPEAKKSEKKGWICTICGFIYEGDVLPDDYICPICKHPASDFQKL